MQTGAAKGLKVPYLFMITEVSIRCQKRPEVGIRRIPPQYTTACSNSSQCEAEVSIRWGVFLGNCQVKSF